MNTKKLPVAAVATLLLTGCNSTAEDDPPLNDAAITASADTSQPPFEMEEKNNTPVLEPTAPDATCDTGTFHDPQTPDGVSNYGAKPDMYRITEAVHIDSITGPTKVRMPIKGKMTTVTLLGVVPNKHTEAAQQHFKDLIGNHKVILEYEPKQGVTNANGETQGYLWTADEEGKPAVLINTAMIADQYATPAGSTGHTPHRLSESFTAAANS